MKFRNCLFFILDCTLIIIFSLSLSLSLYVCFLFCLQKFSINLNVKMHLRNDRMKSIVRVCSQLPISFFDESLLDFSFLLLSNVVRHKCILFLDKQKIWLVML